jgi:hypothetical protein
VQRHYVRYTDDVETIEPGEDKTFDRIIAVMRKGGQITRERYGRAVRTSHAKAHGLLKGELRVRDGLAPELRQGLFATPRTHPVIVRLSHVPGELLDDRRVSTPRGMALKIFDVEGEMLPGHQGERTQDWVLDTGKAFIAPGAKTFLAQITATEMATPMPEGVNLCRRRPLLLPRPQPRGAPAARLDHAGAHARLRGAGQGASPGERPPGRGASQHPRDAGLRRANTSPRFPS